MGRLAQEVSFYILLLEYSQAKSVGQLLFDVVCLCESDNKNQDLEFLKFMVPNGKAIYFIFYATLDK